MFDLKNFRIVDLTCEIVPGERKINGQYLHCVPTHGRPMEVQEFIAYGARMHFIQGQTHLGTHVEAAYKYPEDGLDSASMPLDSYLGEAAVCNFSAKRAGEKITPDDLRRAEIKPRDVFLAFSSDASLNPAPAFTEDAINWLIETKIKLFGAENLDFSAGPGLADCRLLNAGIPVADGLNGMPQIRKNRVFFIGLPLKMRRVSATWTRAIAIEEP